MSSRVFRERHADGHPSDRHTIGRGRIEGDIEETPAGAQISITLKSDSAIGGSEQAAALRGGQPETRVMRRLFDMKHLVSSGTSEFPGFTAVLIPKDAFFIPCNQHPGAA